MNVEANGERVTLTAEALTLELAPALGGSIVRFDAGGVPVLRPASADSASVLDTACFPLVPYVNRIRGGRFACDGREVVLTPNMAGDASPLHGQGWLSAWHVEAASATIAKLSFTHATAEWPWTYEAEQLFALDAAGLTAMLTCRNLSDAPMPCGLGFHPYFPCDAATRLNTGVEGVYTIDANVLPVAREPAQGRYDLRDRQVCGQGLDHGFDGWSGTAAMAWGDGRTVTMRSPTARFFQLYSPTPGDLFVAEPVTHANAALNEPRDRWAELGIVMLAQGEAMTLEMRLDLILPRQGEVAARLR